MRTPCFSSLSPSPAVRFLFSERSLDGAKRNPESVIFVRHHTLHLQALKIPSTLGVRKSGVCGLPQTGVVAGGAADMAARLGQTIPRRATPPVMTLDAEQMAMTTRVQAAMSQPLSPAETLATIDELGELGLLSKQLQSELKECMVLAPQAITGMGWACSGQ